MSDNILTLRVVGPNGYMLNETVENLNESMVAESIKSVLTTVLMAMLDDGTGELSGFVALVPGYVGNTIQLFFTNRKIDKEIKSQNPNKEKLEELQNDLIRDLKDILRILLIASPIPVADGVLAGSIELLNKKTITVTFNTLVGFLKEKVSNFGIIEKLLTYGGQALGFKIISSAVDNIGLINNYIETGETSIDITPSVDMSPELDQDDMEDTDVQIYDRKELLQQLSESRWQVLAGIN